ncbi:hypothetical protein J2T13_001931 [Paenibacillus sp. DS2015]
MAINKVLDSVPKCGKTLETINNVVGVKENKKGYLITMKQDCEPKNGEGPQMSSTFNYVVTSDKIKQLEKDIDRY